MVGERFALEDKLDEHCIICYEELVFESSAKNFATTLNGRDVKKLTCTHQKLFHAECLNDWLARTPSCPCCRQPSISFQASLSEQTFLKDFGWSIRRVGSLALNIFNCGMDL